MHLSSHCQRHLVLPFFCVFNRTVFLGEMTGVVDNDFADRLLPELANSPLNITSGGVSENAGTSVYW